MKQQSKGKGPVFRDADEERKAVRLARQSVFWTQFDLANATGLSQSKLSLYETGAVELGDLERAKIWRAFDRKYQTLKKKTEPLGAEPNLLSGSLSALYPAEWRNAVKEWSTEGAAPDELKMRKLRRQRAGLSQHQLAERLHISRSKLRDFEGGIGKLTPEEHEHWDKELMNSDPWFRYLAVFDFLKGLHEKFTALQEKYAALEDQHTKLQAQFMNAEEISTLRYEQIKELAERIERLQSPLVKGNKE